MPTGSAHAAVLTANIIWAAWNVASRALVSSGTNPVVFATYREIACAVFLLLVTMARRQCSGSEKAIRFAPREWSLLLLCGSVLFSFQVAFLLGVGGADATTAGLSILLVPLIALIGTACLGWEPLPLCRGSRRTLIASWAKLAGIACAFCGCAFLILSPAAHASVAEDGASPQQPPQPPQRDDGTWAVGCAVLFLSGVGTAVFVLAQRPLLERHAADVVMTACYGVAPAVAAGACAVWAVLVQPSPATFGLSVAEAQALAFTVVFASCAAFTLFTYANSVLPATVVTLYGILQPILSSILAVLLLGEPPSHGTMVGGPLVIVGLVVTTLAAPGEAVGSARVNLEQPLLHAT